MLMPVAASWPKLLSVIYGMVAQAIGIAKDLNKMSASAINGGAGNTEDQQQAAAAVQVGGDPDGVQRPAGVGFFLGGCC